MNSSSARDGRVEAPHSLQIVTNDVHPDATTNARLLLDIATGLVESGRWRVEILAGTARGAAGGRPGRLWARLKRTSRRAQRAPSLPWGEENRRPRREINGVRIKRFWHPHLSRARISNRLVNSFFASGLMFLRLLLARRPDVLLVDTTSTFQGPMAWLLSVTRGYRYVYLATELYPDAAIALGYLKDGGMVARLWDWMNRRVYGRASAVIVIGPLLRNKVARHLDGGANDTKLHVIHNWADTNTIKPVEPSENWFRTEHGLQGKLVVLYSGNMGLSHDVETLVEAAELLKDEERVAFMFIGGGPKKPKIQQTAAERGLVNVRFLPFQPPEILPYSLSSGDLSVVTLERAMDDLTIPSKLYPAMSAGQAILALMGPDSDVGKLIEESQTGVRVSQGDAEGLAAALRALLDEPGRLADMKRRARAATVERFARSDAIAAYEEVLDDAIS